MTILSVIAGFAAGAVVFISGYNVGRSRARTVTTAKVPVIVSGDLADRLTGRHGPEDAAAAAREVRDCALWERELREVEP